MPNFAEALYIGYIPLIMLYLWCNHVLFIGTEIAVTLNTTLIVLPAQDSVATQNLDC